MSFAQTSVADLDDTAALRADNRRLRALLDFSREITAERDLRAQLRLLCAELRRATSGPATAVVLRDPEHDAIDAIETIGLPLAVDAKWQKAAREWRPLLEQVPPPVGFRTLASVPLRVGDDRIGLALAFDRQARRPADADAQYLDQIAEAAAMAILNARLYAQSHRELRRRDALRRVVASISSELDLDSLFGRVIAEAVALLEADSGAISLITVDGTARVRAVHNLPAYVVGTVIPPGDGITGKVLEAREAIVVEQYTRDLPRPLLESPHVDAGVAVPVWWQDRLIGVFAVLTSGRSRVFNAQDREIMELLAGHVAIALENARLYREVRDRLAEVTGLQAASTALGEELHPERALRVLAEQDEIGRGAWKDEDHPELMGPEGTAGWVRQIRDEDTRRFEEMLGE